MFYCLCLTNPTVLHALRSNIVIKPYSHCISRTAIGVESFKNGDHEKALKYLNHALKIYEQNSEALVARGAL